MKKDKNFKLLTIGIVILIIIIVIISAFLIFSKSNNHNRTLKIRLDGVGTSSYDWFYELNKEDIVNVQLSYDNSKCKPGYDGCGPDYIYTITPLKQGEVTLTFKQKSIINQDEDDINKTIVYNITVNSDLSINETHHYN